MLTRYFVLEIFFLHSTDDARDSRAESLEVNLSRRQAGQFGAQKGDGASKRLTRPPPTHNRTSFRASCPRIRRGLNADCSLWTSAWTKHGHRRGLSVDIGAD